MANNQRSREKRREERETEEAKAQGADRRSQLLKLAAAGVFLAIIAVVVVIIVVSGGSSKGGDASNVEHQTEVQKLIGNIPQHGTVLGPNSAKTTLYMYGDLQCPICREYIEEILPEIIETNIAKEGSMKMIYRDFIIIGPESIPAGEAAIAAGKQGKGWTFIQLFYRNQGEENSGYVTEEFIESIGKASGIPDFAKWNEERKSGKYKKEVEATTEQAEKFGFSGTPSFAVEGPHSNGIELIGTPESQQALEEDIKKAS